MKMIRRESASYRNGELIEFQNNPLIEALPPMRDLDYLGRKLMIRPPYERKDRKLPGRTRLEMTQRIIRFHQPTVFDIDIATRLDKCIRWGYTGRNPLSAAYAGKCAATHDALLQKKGINYLDGYHPNTYGFAIIGISGIGKSTTVESILSQYPQVIAHTNYKGLPFNTKQDVWIKLDCACDGSLKGFCTDFFRELDRLHGTEYCDRFSARRCTLDTMLVRMAQLTSTYNVGILVIDEIQHLCGAGKAASNKALNFFVSLVNTIGVPVLMVGTPKALVLLQEEFQQAKRGSGQGDVLWERMQEDDTWDIFLRSMWEYQYTSNTVRFSKSMKRAFYHESQGIPFLAVHIYKLVQEDAILSGRETFTADDIHRIAAEKMKLTQPMRKAIREGRDIDLLKYVDISPFKESDYYDNYSITPERDLPANEITRQDPLEDAVITLLRLGLGINDARSYATSSILKLGDSATPSLIASDAFLTYTSTKDSPASPSATAEPLFGATTYAELKEQGLVAQEVL